MLIINIQLYVEDNNIDVVEQQDTYSYLDGLKNLFHIIKRNRGHQVEVFDISGFREFFRGIEDAAGKMTQERDFGGMYLQLSVKSNILNDYICARLSCQ